MKLCRADSADRIEKIFIPLTWLYGPMHEGAQAEMLCT
jgi:hypothetical protein